MLHKKTVKRKSYRGRFLLRRIKPFLKYFLLISVIVGAAYAVQYFLYDSDFFKVKYLRITGAKSFVNITDLTEVVKGSVYGKSIFTVNVKGLEKTLQENFQGAKDLKIYKVYPGTISVEVYERVPLAVVYKDPNGDYYLVDDEGYILGLVDKDRTNLPQIKFEGTISIGSFVDKRMIPIYLELVRASNSEKINVSSISFYPKYAQMYVNDGVQVLISNDKDKTDSVKVMSNLLKQLILEGKRVKKIDLRYDKVIVSYQ